VVVNFGATESAAQGRPALIVQNDRDNARTTKTIVVQITGNPRRAYEETHHLIDHSHPDWAASGLRMPSAVNASSVFYVRQLDVISEIGHLSDATMQQINDCLKAALELT